MYREGENREWVAKCMCRCRITTRPFERSREGHWSTHTSFVPMSPYMISVYIESNALFCGELSRVSQGRAKDGGRRG